MRHGAKKRPFYRVVAADSRRQRDGRFIEIIGHYDPIAKPHTLKVDTEKAAKWIAVGAQPSQQVASLLRQAGMKLGGPKAAKTETAAAPKAAKKKAAKKRAVRRKASERKTEKKAARKVAKAAGKPGKAKKKKTK
jgi:small subunit ribosomal protein S16